MPRLLLAALALVLAAPLAAAQTDVSGTLDANTTWGTAGSPYTVTNTVTVAGGVTLTVEDGVEVRFVNGRSLVVQGSLTATGATFTADSESPGRSTWGDIRVLAGAVATLTNSAIEYADQAIQLFEGGTATLTGVTIRNVRVGVEAEPADAVGSREYDVWASGGLALTDVVVVESYVVAYFNTPVPYTIGGDNSFSGNDFEAIFVQFYAHRGTWTVPAGPTVVWWFVNAAISDELVLEPGAVVKSQNRRRRVRELTAVGEVGNPIVVTAYGDDSAGGDANNNVSTAGPGQAGELEVVERATVRNAEFRFGDAGGLRLDGSEGEGGMTATVTDTDFVDAQVGLYLASVGVTVSGTTFSGIGQYPVEVGVGVSGSIDPSANVGLLSYLPTRFDIAGTADAARRDTLYDLGLTYVLVAPARVREFAELTVNPGVVVKSNLYGIDVQGGGVLSVEGTEAAPVVFTSWKDDSAGVPGDLNGDGNTTIPGPNDWDGFFFQPGSVGSFDQAEVRYASRSSFVYLGRSYTRGAVNAAGATLTVTDSRLANARLGLVAVGEGDLGVSGTTFSNIEQTPLALDVNVTPTFSGNAMENVGLAALGIVRGPARAAATLPQRDFAGVTNITYALLGDLTVEEGVEVTVSSGVVIKSFGYNSVLVDGGLRLVGSVGEPVVFTEYRDDSVGNPRDTNGDGNETAPAAGSWQGLHYRRTTLDAASPVSTTEIRYARTGLALSEADLTVTGVQISNVGYTGLAVDRDTAPTIDGLTIRNAPATSEPILLSLRSSPTITNLALVATGSRGIGLLEDIGDTFIPRREMLEDATLAPRAAAGIPNIAYVLRSQLTIPRLRTLTIAPGTLVKFRSGQMWVEGGLVADAAGAAPIVMTDFQDDAAGGDTNADGNASAPSRGGWNLRFRPTSLPASVLRNVQVRYGNRIYLDEAAPRIEGSTIEQMAGPLTITGAGSPAIVDNQFLNISTVPVAVSPFARPAFSGNTVANVPTLALGLLGGTFVSDFTLAPQTFAGFENITYVPFDGGVFNVESGATLTIPAGTVFKFDAFFSTGLTITGALRTEGTAANPVVLTAIGDDRYGNPADTNQDGATAPGRSAATLIRLTDATDDAGTVLDGLVLAHATVGVEMTSASPTVRNSRFEFMEQVGIDLLEVSAPTLENNTFAHFDRFGVPLRFSLASDFTASGNAIEGQTMQALGIRPEALASDARLSRRSFAGRAGIPYFLAGTYTVGTGATLTIDPGVVVKANGSGSIRVRKGLVAVGGEAPGDKVVFTTITDDFYGGDTNRDSSATAPSAGGGWGGITFENESIDALTRLDQVILRYASEAIRAESAAPTITNALFQFNRIGLHAIGAANPSVTASDFDGHTQWAVHNEGTFSVDATNNYWAADSGPTAPGNPGGTGEPISGDVAFTPFVGGTQNPALGDVSLNGLVQAFDAAAILGHLVAPSLSDLQLSVADVSGNGEVMALDASYVLQFVVGLIDAFPAEAEARQRAVPSAAGVTLEVGPWAGAVGDTVRVPVTLGGAGADVYALELAVRAVGATVVGLEAGPAAAGAAADARATGDTGRLAIAAPAPFAAGPAAVVTLRIDDADARLGVERAVANETLLDARAVDLEGPPPSEVGLALVGASPFRGTTALRVDLPEPSAVRLEVVDALGRRVVVLLDADRGAGSHRVVWDARDVSPGVYFVRMIAAGAVSTARLVVVR